MKRFWILFFLVVVAGLSAKPAESAADALPVTRFELDNGLRVLLLPLQRAPVVSCRLFYVTGSVHEHAGNTGIAHLLEHMLFKGTRKIGIKDSVADLRFLEALDSANIGLVAARRSGDTLKAAALLEHRDSLQAEHRELFIDNELWELYTQNGGTGLNAFTSDMMTAYFVSLPKNKLELFFWLESDRMQNAVLRAFDSEHLVVREERRMRYDDSPTGRYFETLNALFWEGHPYRTPTIGWPSDIASLTRQQAQQHYDRFYKPNNAILVLVGDFETVHARELVERYFAPIPAGDSMEEINFVEPTQVGPKRFVQYKDGATPRIDLMFHTPGLGDRDLFALDVAEAVLSGRTGRLYRELVERKQVATGVYAGNAAQKWESSFDLSLVIRPGVLPEEAEEALWTELRRLQNELISTQELEKVKNQLLAGNWRRLRDMDHLATQLAFFEMNGDWTLVTRFAEEVAKTTTKEVMEVARRYFRLNNSTTGMMLPDSLSPEVAWDQQLDESAQSSVSAEVAP